MSRRFSPEEGALFSSIKAKREELIKLIGRIDVDGSPDAARGRREAIDHLSECVRLALRALAESAVR